MKIVCISDTHGQHADLVLPPGDMIIHAGDVTKRGRLNQVKDFLLWFSKLPYPHKIFIAGNHDFYFENAPREEVEELIPEGVTYLNDSGVTVEGWKIWGSPVQPWFLDWAFNRERGPDIRQHWELIPEDVDILVTHGPAFGVLDKTVRGESVGCEDLKVFIEKVRPKIHLCGHIHEGYGQSLIKDTLFINASVLDIGYRLTNEPVVVELTR